MATENGFRHPPSRSSVSTITPSVTTTATKHCAAAAPTSSIQVTSFQCGTDAGRHGRPATSSARSRLQGSHTSSVRSKDPRRGGSVSTRSSVTGRASCSRAITSTARRNNGSKRTKPTCANSSAPRWPTIRMIISSRRAGRQDSRHVACR